MNEINLKKPNKKIIIMLIIVMLFNFVMPNYSNAGVLIAVFARLGLIIPEAIWNGLQILFLSITV